MSRRRHRRAFPPLAAVGAVAALIVTAPPAEAEAPPASESACPRGLVRLDGHWVPLAITGAEGRSMDFVGTETLRRWLEHSAWKLQPLPFAALADAPRPDREELLAALQVRGGWLVAVNLPALGGGVAYYDRKGERYAVLEAAGVERLAAVGEGAVATITRYDSQTGSGEAVFLHPDPDGRWQAGPRLDLPGAPVFLAAGRQNLVLIKYDVPEAAAGGTALRRVGRAFAVSADGGFKEVPCQ